jgi:hypothetical protein
MHFRRAFVVLVLVVSVTAPSYAPALPRCVRAIVSAAVLSMACVSATGCGRDAERAAAIAEATSTVEIEQFRAGGAPAVESSSTVVAGVTYFTKGGFVFRSDAGERPALVRGSSNVAALLGLNGVLFARQDDGDVYVLVTAEGKEQWVDIGNRARALAKTDGELFAVTKRGELWRYQGRPGAANYDVILMPMLIPDGNNGFTTIFIPQVSQNGRRVAFEATGATHVRRVEATPAGVEVHFEDGTRRPLADFGGER